MNYKHNFIYYISENQYLTDPSILTGGWYCKICCRESDNMFATQYLTYKNFGSKYEQEIWLNQNCPCLTIEEKVIKELIE